MDGFTTSAVDVLGVTFLFPLMVAEGNGVASTLLLGEIIGAAGLRFAGVGRVPLLRIPPLLGGGSGEAEVVLAVDRVDGAVDLHEGRVPGIDGAVVFSFVFAERFDGTAVVRSVFAERFDGKVALRTRTGEGPSDTVLDTEVISFVNGIRDLGLEIGSLRPGPGLLVLRQVFDRVGTTRSKEARGLSEGAGELA